MFWKMKYVERFFLPLSVSLDLSVTSRIFNKDVHIFIVEVEELILRYNNYADAYF